MASSLKIASLATILLLATPQARGWAQEEDDQVSELVTTTMRKPVVVVPSGVGTMVGSPDICVECQCCNWNSGNCQRMRCCAKRNCKPRIGECTIVEDCSCRC